MNTAAELVDFTTPEHQLIERDEALALLARDARRASEGHGAAVLLDGGEWLGKSSLISALRQIAEAQGMDVLGTRGREFEEDFAFGVVMALFEGAAGERRPR